VRWKLQSGLRRRSNMNRLQKELVCILTCLAFHIGFPFSALTLCWVTGRASRWVISAVFPCCDIHHKYYCLLGVKLMLWQKEWCPFLFRSRIECRKGEAQCVSGSCLQEECMSRAFGGLWGRQSPQNRGLWRSPGAEHQWYFTYAKQFPYIFTCSKLKIILL